MDPTAHMQAILHQLHSQLASASQPPPPASASTPMPLPVPWHPTADLIRQMRAAATSMYEQVLDENEREKAKEFGWTPTPAAAVAAAASATVVQAPQSGTSALSLQSSASFHRFSVPLAPLLDNFLAASSSVRSIVSYHTALIACLQAATRTPAGMAAAGAVAAGSPSAQQLQQLSRTFLFTLKQRVELQRQVARVQGNFARAQHAIQQELQQRKRRQQIQGESVALAAIPVEAADVSLPPCDLFSITASLGLLRAQLSLVKSNDDPAAAYSIQPPGSIEISSDKTSDGRDVATLALEDAEEDVKEQGAAVISTKALACEKHMVNLSSTGTEECFVYDICLIKPLLRSDEDRAVVLQLLREVAALPRGIDSLHPQSSLSQMLRHGFCIHGKLEALSGNEHLLDAEEIRLVYLHDFDAYASKIAFRVELERLCDAHPDLKLFTKQTDVLTVLQTMEKEESLPLSADVKSRPQLMGRMSVHTKVEGPCITFRDRLARGAPPALVAVSKRNELGITCVGVEKVYSFEQQQANGAQPMDTSSSSAAPAVSSSSPLPFTFAYRFILSHPLLLTFQDASLLFGWPAASSSSTAATSAPSSHGSDTPIREGSFYQLCRNHSVPFLMDPTQGKNVYCNVLGSKQEYAVVMEPTEAGAKATLQEPALLLSSFLCRSLDQLPAQLRQCRDLFLYQRLYRSIFEPIDAHFHLAPASTQLAVAAPAAVQSVPSSAAPAPAPLRPAKLKFSYRQFISEESNTGAPPQQQQHDVGVQPRSDNAATTVQLQAAASSSIVLHCKHPLTGADLEVRVQFAGSSTPSVTVQCANGSIPSSAFASALLHSTASVPVLLHSLLDRCKRAKRA